MRAMQVLTNADINNSVVNAQDFSVRIIGMPEHDSVRNLKAEVWRWIEQVNEKEKAKLVDPENDIID